MAWENPGQYSVPFCALQPKRSATTSQLHVRAVFYWRQNKAMEEIYVTAHALWIVCNVSCIIDVSGTAMLCSQEKLNFTSLFLTSSGLILAEMKYGQMECASAPLSARGFCAVNQRCVVFLASSPRSERHCIMRTKNDKMTDDHSFWYTTHTRTFIKLKKKIARSRAHISHWICVTNSGFIACQVELAASGSNQVWLPITWPTFQGSTQRISSRQPVNLHR